MDDTFAVNGKTCCPRCQYFHNCIRRWILGERGIPSTCCSLCKFSNECYEAIPPSKRLDDDPIKATESLSTRLSASLSEKGYTCCPRCEHFSTCSIRLHRESHHLPSHCCSSCSLLQQCAEGSPQRNAKTA